MVPDAKKCRKDVKRSCCRCQLLDAPRAWNLPAAYGCVGLSCPDVRDADGPNRTLDTRSVKACGRVQKLSLKQLVAIAEKQTQATPRVQSELDC